jgi:N-acetylmuramoyl-L-alanine amidase
MKKTLLILGIVLLAALMLWVGVYLLIEFVSPFSHSIVADVPTNVKENDEIFANTGSRPIIILDAGHGGEDSGAVGVDGVLEKDLNFSLTMRLRDLLIFEGWRVILTRESDVLLYDPKLDLSHKVQDLKNRLDFGTIYPDAIFVSIHMNKFPAQSCKGLQIYYSPNHISSQTLAQRIQADVKTHLAPENHRLCKKATTSIYILSRIQNPAILIECGFISNHDEAALLQTSDYQQELMAVIGAGLYNEFCFNQTKNLTN